MKLKVCGGDEGSLVGMYVVIWEVRDGQARGTVREVAKGFVVDEVEVVGVVGVGGEFVAIGGQLVVRLILMI